MELLTFIVFALLCMLGNALKIPRGSLNGLTLVVPRGNHTDQLKGASAASSMQETVVANVLLIPTNERIVQSALSQFQSASVVASLNAVLFALRPDPTISWQLRIPRVLWEIAIAVIAKSTARQLSPGLCLLLAIMTGTTALTDVFVWAPIYSNMADFETCYGGWFTGEEYRCYKDYTKGFSRLLVVFQSLVGGLIYLFTAIAAFTSYTAFRDEQKVLRQNRVQQATANTVPSAMYGKQGDRAAHPPQP